MRIFRNHGITSDHRQRTEQGSWFYEMVDLGYNYRITDIQCALGLSQLKRLPKFLERRRQIAMRYDDACSQIPEITPLAVRQDATHAYHLYVVKMDFEALGIDRSTLFQTLWKKGIGVNVHYIPVHLHPYYRQHFNTRKGDCPMAEAAYESILTLPAFPAMSGDDVDAVITALGK